MIHTETVGGRTHTWSDTYKIRQMDTGVVYDDAMDTVQHEYEETDIPLEPEELSDTEALRLITGGVTDGT